MEKANVDEHEKRERLADLSLLLLYLSSWEEPAGDNGRAAQIRSWKGYRFDVLDLLESGQMIEQRYNWKSVLLTPRGVERARNLSRTWKEKQAS